LRLFCGAFLLSFTPLLFSFITPSSLQSSYCLGPSLLWKKVDNRPNFCFGTLPIKIGTRPQFLLWLNNKLNSAFRNLKFKISCTPCAMPFAIFHFQGPLFYGRHLNYNKYNLKKLTEKFSQLLCFNDLFT
jgi:hypothetical protein